MSQQHVESVESANHRTHCIWLLTLASFLLCAGTGSAKVQLDCPEHTRLEDKPSHKGVEAHCVLGDGTRQGPWGGWYKSGQRAIAGHYENGRLHGEETEWYDATELSGWRHFRSHFRKPKRSRTRWSVGQKHGESIEWDSKGRVLQRSTWHRGEFVRYKHPKDTIAEDKELGLLYVPPRKPQGCFERRYYPHILSMMMGRPVAGYSGYEILYGTNKNCGREEHPCRRFSHPQLSDIMGQKIQGYADTAKFAVVTCRTDEDKRRQTAVEEHRWRKQSAVYRDPGVVAFLHDMHGVWCGRSTHDASGRLSHREIRIEFIANDPERAALLTDTWDQIPGGPVGEPGYVMAGLIIPMPRSGIEASSVEGDEPLPNRIHFKTVSVHSNAGGYQLSRDSQEVVFHHRRRTYPMSQDCSGFWAPPGPDPNAPSVAPEHR